MLDMMSQPLVSIIIPCMNEENTIEICIKKALSTLLQEGLVGEIIVSDNSTDNSKNIAEKLGLSWDDALFIDPKKIIENYGYDVSNFRHFTFDKCE